MILDFRFQNDGCRKDSLFLLNTSILLNVNLFHGKVEQENFLIFSKSPGGCRALMTNQKFLNEAFVWSCLVVVSHRNTKSEVNVTQSWSSKGRKQLGIFHIFFYFNRFLPFFFCLRESAWEFWPWGIFSSPWLMALVVNKDLKSFY